jgi:hypothetical protein
MLTCIQLKIPCSSIAYGSKAHRPIYRDTNRGVHYHQWWKLDWRAMFDCSTSEAAAGNGSVREKQPARLGWSADGRSAEPIVRIHLPPPASLQTLGRTREIPQPNSGAL